MIKMKKASVCLIITLILLMGIALPGAFAQTVTVTTGTTYQTMEGFGAAIAWMHSWLTEHPNKNELYDLLFQQLGLDIFRLRNQYRNIAGFDYPSTEIVSMGTASLGISLPVFLCSWSPPADLKKDGILNGGTLIQENGTFVYSKFADYWYNSLVAYAAKGIVPKYISIQNEVDYENTGWETCIFKPTEDGTYPAYGTALNAVYTKCNGMSNMPKFLGPEVCGVANSLAQTYLANLTLSQIYGIAHHLYNGGDANNPDTFNTNFQALAAAYPGKPIFQTEYDQGTAFTTALLMYNSLTVEGVVSYFYWDLIWDTSQRPLIALEDPFNTSGWSTTGGYIISDFYYVFKHFSKFTDPGFIRVSAASDTSTLKSVAFKSADNTMLTIILINNNSSAATATLNLGGFTVSSSEVYRTIPGGTDKWASAGSLGSTVSLPANSIVTIACYSSSHSPTATPAPLPTPILKPSTRSAFQQIEAESYNAYQGIKTELIDDNGGRCVGYIENYDYLKFSSVDFGTGATGFAARAASAGSGGNIEIRLDANGGTLVGTCAVPVTGDWLAWTDVSCTVSGATGVHDLYLVFTNGSSYLYNLDYVSFTGGSSITTAPTDVATIAPTDAPTAEPTAAPNETIAPTDAPTVTPAPTDTPAPTSVPTATPYGVTADPTTPPTVTADPTTPPTVTADPTTPPSETTAPGTCTCTNLCTSQTAITVPFTKDGTGEFCYTSSSLATYVNSWNCDAVNINGTNCTNTYVSSSSIAAISGVYYIYYKASYSWSHLEIK